MRPDHPDGRTARTLAAGIRALGGATHAAAWDGRHAGSSTHHELHGTNTRFSRIGKRGLHVGRAVSPGDGIGRRCGTTSPSRDPASFEQPWRGRLWMTRTDDIASTKYACHEGNYSMAGILRRAREPTRRSNRRKNLALRFFCGPLRRRPSRLSGENPIQRATGADAEPQHQRKISATSFIRQAGSTRPFRPAQPSPSGRTVSAKDGPEQQTVPSSPANGAAVVTASAARKDEQQQGPVDDHHRPAAEEPGPGA